MMIACLLVLAMIASLAAAAFFAGVETGFLSVSRERVLHLAREGGKKALIVQRAISEMSWTTTTLLIGNNFASVAYSSASAALALELCPDSTARMLWGFFAAFLVLYVSEFLPKLMLAARPLRRTLLLAPTYHWVELILKPVTSLAILVTDLFIPRKGESKYRMTVEDLLRILEDRKDGVCLSDFESALISRLIVLRVKGRKITPEEILDAISG